ncbi:methyltransferase [Streptomyces sp. ISL-99]|uniref:methyltransferase n=1 Tax=Streptomyces sp. ISL-99 TaxID=2819193 RepID=UPI0035B0A5CA
MRRNSMNDLPLRKSCQSHVHAYAGSQLRQPWRDGLVPRPVVLGSHRGGAERKRIGDTRPPAVHYATLYDDPDRLDAFQQAMTGLSMRSAHALAEAIDWSAYRTVADIGCAEGTVLTHLLERHPHLRGTGFDLAAVRPSFQRRHEESGLGDRLAFRPGDFFAEPLPQADVLVFGHILSKTGPCPRRRRCCARHTRRCRRAASWSSTRPSSMMSAGRTFPDCS